MFFLLFQVGELLEGRVEVGAGHPAQPWLGIVLAAAVTLVAAAPAVLADKAALLVAIGIVLAAVGAFVQPEPRVGLTTWISVHVLPAA